MLRSMPRADVKRIIRAWATTEVHARQTLAEAMRADGWEPVDVPVGAATVGTGDDARPVTWIKRQAYALPPNLFRERQAARLAAAKARAEAEAEKPAPGEALTSVLCPMCRAVMAKQPVCPRCKLGKQGYKILCQCTECGHEVPL